MRVGMLRRIILAVMGVSMWLASSAQLAVGSWKQYPVFGEFSGLVDTGECVWYLTGGCLYRYDKDADETRFYEGGKDLSGFGVKLMRYDRDNDMLAVAYSDGNIDVILGDGSRVNLPDIKDTMLDVDRSVNDIRFSGDEMYVATGFGLVVYDTRRMEVKASGVYRKSIATVFVTPEHVVIVPSVNAGELYTIYGIGRDKSINKFENFSAMGQHYDVMTDQEPLDDERRTYALVRTGRLGAIQFRSDGTYAITDNVPVGGAECKSPRISRGSDGVVRFLSTATGVMGHYEGPTSAVADITLPESLRDNFIASDKGLRSVWLAGQDGVGNYRISDAGDITVLRDKSVPSDAITFSDVCNIFPSGDNGAFYIANMGMTVNFTIGSDDFFDVRLNLNKISREGNINIDPVGVSAYTSPALNQQKRHGKYIFSPTQIAEDPDCHDRLFIGSGAEGVYVIEDGVEIAKFDGNNAPINKNGNYYWGTVCVTIDPQGNLWVGSRGEPEETTFIMLPADKRKRKDLSTLTHADWIIADYEDFLRSKDIRLLFCSKCDIMLGIDGVPDRGFLVVDHRGTMGDISDDKSIVHMRPVDQDGKTFVPLHFVCMAEDKRGHVWMGTSSGVISISDPSKALDESFRINRIKVPRNDGSGLADYLLESDYVSAIAVDNSNRKWIGTNGSGLYLVSEDGDAIISHFTIDNSLLPSNVITTLRVDPESNSVFVGTRSGLYEYSSTSSPAKPDYSGVYAYPNPVTPDYTGWITIAGLMDNSLVKITDADMHLVYQTTSNGGMAMWDGCNTSGARVRSGVYYVFASTSSADTAGDVVAKILVVN